MKRYLLYSVFFLLALNNQAQTGRYWGTQFNSKSSLLGDAVVGSSSGIASIYFNPAGIIDVENNSLSISTNLITLSYETYKNGLGDGTKLVDWGFVVQPRFATMIYRPKDNKNMAYQFAILKRNSREIFVYDEVSMKKDLLNQGFGENYHGTFSLSSEYYDYWGGAGVAYRMSDVFQFGASAFMSVKNFRYNEATKAFLYPERSLLPDSIDFYSAEWMSSLAQVSYDVRLTGKLGVIGTFGNLKIGLNITLPSAHVYGNGDVAKSLYQTGLSEVDTMAKEFNYFEAGKYRKVTFKDPFSAALGLAFRSNSGKAVYYFTSEYFAPVKRYKMIDGTKVVSSAKDEYAQGTDFLSFYYQAASVVNFAVGYRYIFSDKMELLSGFKTDFDATLDRNSGNAYDELSTFHDIPANFYHFNIGGKMNVKMNSFTLGFQLTYGQNRNHKQFANFTEPVIYNPETKLGLQGERQNTMQYSYFDVGFYLGFVFGF